VTCIAAVITYLLSGRAVDWSLVLALGIGVALSTPVAALIVNKMDGKHLKVIIGALTLVLGALTVFKTVRVL